ncbi:MAG TPA: hypothetical protein VF444_13840 [Pseudonocardiaceae bacterium]
MTGFKVDLTALTEAAQGLTDTVNDVSDESVTDIVSDPAALGHDGLAGTLSYFCSRWQVGVRSLAKDGQIIAGRLTNNVLGYQQAEREIHG